MSRKFWTNAKNKIFVNCKMEYCKRQHHSTKILWTYYVRFNNVMINWRIMDIVMQTNFLPENCLYPPNILCFHHLTMFPAIVSSLPRSNCCFISLFVLRCVKFSVESTVCSVGKFYWATPLLSTIVVLYRAESF